MTTSLDPDLYCPPTDLGTLESVSVAHVRHTLRALGGNMTLAAKSLGIDRRTLYRWVKRHQIEIPRQPTSLPPAASDSVG